MHARRLDPVFASERDAHALAEMSRDLVEAGLGWTYQTRRIAGLIRDPETVALVTRDSSHAVGFAIMAFGDDRAHLVLLAVQPTHRRRGVARRLLAWLLDSAKAAGMASVHVELRADNAPAYALYSTLGFAETLRVPRYYRGRETAVRMLRVLRVPGTAPPAWQPPTVGER